MIIITFIEYVQTKTFPQNPLIFLVVGTIFSVFIPRIEVYHNRIQRASPFSHFSDEEIIYFLLQDIQQVISEKNTVFLKLKNGKLKKFTVKDAQ